MPEKINKTTFVAFVFIALCAGTIGYAFGLDKGYATGLSDGGRQPMPQQSLQAP
jgi:hypothetical protein